MSCSFFQKNAPASKKIRMRLDIEGAVRPTLCAAVRIRHKRSASSVFQNVWLSYHTLHALLISRTSCSGKYSSRMMRRTT